MQQITLLLEDDEIALLRGGVRMFEFFNPEENELIDTYRKKILEATNDVGFDVKKQIGIMQRAMRRIRITPEFSELQSHFKILESMLATEMQKEENGDF